MQLIYKSTSYGSSDIISSQNYITSSNVCDVLGSSCPIVVVSENLFGVTEGTGAGSVYRGCWSLTVDRGMNLVVKVNNLCPIQGSLLCNMQTLMNVYKEGMYLPIFLTFFDLG